MEIYALTLLLDIVMSAFMKLHLKGTIIQGKLYWKTILTNY